jgi:hypothetical protein
MYAPPRAAPSADAFALSRSSLNAFLFAEVGAEQNGSDLTILSTLARLGKDPWAQAAEWAKLPDAVTIECLTESILQMPLCPRSLAEANVTAGRLVMLLPRLSKMETPIVDRLIADIKLPAWLPLAVFAAVLGLAVAAGTLAATPGPAAENAAPPSSAPVVQTIEHGGQ